MRLHYQPVDVIRFSSFAGSKKWRTRETVFCMTVFALTTIVSIVQKVTVKLECNMYKTNRATLNCAKLFQCPQSHPLALMKCRNKGVRLGVL